MRSKLCSINITKRMIQITVPSSISDFFRHQLVVKVMKSGSRRSIQFRVFREPHSLCFIKSETYHCLLGLLIIVENISATRKFSWLSKNQESSQILNNTRGSIDDRTEVLNMINGFSYVYGRSSKRNRILNNFQHQVCTQFRMKRKQYPYRATKAISCVAKHQSSMLYFRIKKQR